MTISTDPQVVESLKRALHGGPITSALLKVLLEKDLLATTGQGLTQRLPQFRKFSKFLFANTDILDVRPPTGPGDIVVGLRGVNPPLSGGLTRAPLSPSSSGSIPAPIWVAFTNPDPERKRFVQRETCAVEHFLAPAGDEEERYKQLAGDPAYIEIKPITASVQSNWMQEFLASGGIDLGPLTVLKTIAAQPYSAPVNRIWQSALGEDAQRWRTFRGGRVADFVRQWAAENHVAVGKVLPEPLPPMPVTPALAIEPTGESPIEISFKNSLHKLIDLLSEEELRQVVLPLHLAAKLLFRQA